MAVGTLGIVPQLLAIEAKPRRFALAEWGFEAQWNGKPG